MAQHLPDEMKSRALWFVLITTIASASPACSSDEANNPSNAHPLPASLQQKVDNLRADLEARGYAVSSGFANLFTIDDCRLMIAKLGKCFGNNPAAPYVFPSVPLWPDEFADPQLTDVAGPMPEGTQVNFRLDEREALVILEQTPPPGKYYGTSIYVFTRQGTWDPNDQIYQSITDPYFRDLLFQRSPNPARTVELASFGNNVNDVVVERQSGAAFDQERFFIVTPDAVMERAVTDALLRAGVPNRNQVFTSPVSKDVVRVGLGPEADDLWLWMRYAHPDDEQAGERWRQQLPLAVLRVRDMNKARKAEPYPKEIYDDRIAHSEVALEGDLAALRNAVKQRWGQTAAPELSFQSLEQTVDGVGQHCLERHQSCGDQRDEDWRISPRSNMDSGEVLAVVGTLKTTTGNATYSAISVNRADVIQGVGNVFGEEIAGSASSFASTVGNTDHLYVHYFARNCSGLPRCFEVSEEMIPKGETINFIERNYVVPGTARGALPAPLLNASVIVLDGARRPSSP